MQKPIQPEPGSSEMGKEDELSEVTGKELVSKYGSEHQGHLVKKPHSKNNFCWMPVGVEGGRMCSGGNLSSRLPEGMMFWRSCSSETTIAPPRSRVVTSPSWGWFRKV